MTEVKHLRLVTIEDPSNPGAIPRILREGHAWSKPDCHASGEDVMRSIHRRRTGEVDDELLGTANPQIPDRVQHPGRRRRRNRSVPIRPTADEGPNHPSSASDQTGSKCARHDGRTPCR